MKKLFLQRAEENMPELIGKKIVPDPKRATFKRGDELVIDLGNHYVGYFSFKLEEAEAYLDAPVRLSVKFGETKKEIEDDFSLYKGDLCASWLQEEFLTLDFAGECKMPRRYAARYIQIKVLATPQEFVLSDFCFEAVSSGDERALQNISIRDKELEKIDAVAVNTLKNCMHRVFEDGPKRDRRLWIGDLRLEALADYVTFGNLPLVRRCLYLFAAADTDANGFMASHLYENPKFASGNWMLEDYALLYVASVCDYYQHTGDRETFDALYPVVKGQMAAADGTLDKDGIMTVVKGAEAFIDWCRGLEKITALHGVYLYVLKLLEETLTQMGHADAGIYEAHYEKARESALKVLYNKEEKNFKNARDHHQYSVHGAVWMILGGVVSGEEGKEILTAVLNSKESVKPFTPYMHHYVVEAMVKLGMMEEAKAYIKNYWGGMIALGADTFYEAYVPEDPDFSPYGDRMINSMCHAWSCTPTYFIRKYFSK